jgi:hypothetical protein
MAAGAWVRPFKLRPTPQLVYPSPLSKEDVRALIKMPVEVASRLEQYELEQQLAAAKARARAESKRQKAELNLGQGGGDRQPQAGARSVERPGEVIGKFGSRVVAPGPAA